MNPGAPFPAPLHRRIPGTGCWILSSALLLLLFTGCSSISRRFPGRTVVEVEPTTVPARIISNFFLIETPGPDGVTHRFLLDTGSTISYVTPDLAGSYGLKQKKNAPRRTVQVRSANGGEIELETVTLSKITIGQASFERVPAVIFDLVSLSSHLGLQIDGIIGFPVFRNTLLTMDYPGRRLVIAPYPAMFAPLPRQTPQISTIAFNNQQGTPLIPVQLGNESFIVLIDTGSDGSLNLNPAGLHPRFANGPRIGTIVSSLQGDRRQLTGRLDQDILIGAHVVQQPIVDLTEQLSSIGGEFLRHFSLTFDQRRNQVTLGHEGEGPVLMTSRRHTGLSFARSSVYWRVLAVIPDTPAAKLPIQAGDLCVRINGEPVEQWGYERYAALLASATKITCTFLAGSKETDLEVPVIDLVP